MDYQARLGRQGMPSVRSSMQAPEKVRQSLSRLNFDASKEPGSSGQVSVDRADPRALIDRYLYTTLAMMPQAGFVTNGLKCRFVSLYLTKY